MAAMAKGRRRVCELRRAGDRWWASPLGEPAGREPTPVEVVAGKVRDGDLALCGPERDGHRWRVVGAPLARAGGLRAELYRIAIDAGVDPTYPPDVLAEAAAAERLAALDDPSLVDLRQVPFVTVDSPDARDLDQALHLARDRDGFLLRYAVADASHFVGPGSALLQEALSRGASYYLPGLSVPMLPRSLSEGVISLNPGVDRRAVVFEIRLAADGACRSATLVRARVRSVRKLSYRQVQRLWDDPAGSPLATAPFAGSLGLLRTIGELRLAEARRRHVVSYQRREVEIRLGGERGGFTVLVRDRLPVEQCNEQVSLLCNVEGARMLLANRRRRHVQPVYRVHPAPSPEALERLERMVAAVSAARSLDWRWRRDLGEPLADWVERLPRSGRMSGVARALERQALLANRRSTFETAPGPHHGVGAPVYARFTAPMREVVGVFTHKEALEALAGPDAATPEAADLELREHVVAAANRARDLQRTLTKRANRAVLDRIFGAELAAAGGHPQHRGTVLGMTPRRLYVGLDDPPVEVKVELDPTGDVPWSVDDAEICATPPPRSGLEPVRLGDRVEVAVTGLDRDRDRWRFSVRRG